MTWFSSLSRVVWTHRNAARCGSSHRGRRWI